MFENQKVSAHSDNLFELATSPHTYSGKYLEAIDFPLGPIGGSVIRMNGKAERHWWHIFNNWLEVENTGKLPNSFFAIRTKCKGVINVRALQTVSIGMFPAMKDLFFQGEYPFAWYHFIEAGLPIEIKLETYNPFIPMNLKDSSIPCAIFRITSRNTTDSDVEVSILASQQNASGFDGYGEISGNCIREFKGYGSNVNTIVTNETGTTLKMHGSSGSMQLTAYETDMSYTASWNTPEDLYNDFYDDGIIEGNEAASSSTNGITVDGAMAKTFSLPANSEKTITFVLCWHFPSGSFGREDIPEWNFTHVGEQYENWWRDANDVDSYVRAHFDELDSMTRLFHDTFYSSTIPRYALDRIISQLCVLRSPTAFWTKDGYFGLWESTSNNEQWYGNCKHVYHYTQATARLFPELGRILREQDLCTQTEEGLFPSRDGEKLNALDGHLGTILGIYREHLLSDENTWLNGVWLKVKKAMNYVVLEYDQDRDGMISGKAYHNTLDCNTSGTSPWIGTLYLAALKACSKMSEIVGDGASVELYERIFENGVFNQNINLWDEKLGYYVENPGNIAGTVVMGNACSIDMFLGQWWSNQLGLGQIYPDERTRIALSKIYVNNKIQDKGDYKTIYRDFLGIDDIGWMMFKFPDDIPENHILYYNEVMSGFEYCLASTMLQYGMFSEGFDIIKNISKRYDGRLRDSSEVSCYENACVFGCGSPFGEDECGDFYGRPLSSWSILLALQGFIYDGPAGTLGFKPQWRMEDHISFFTSSEGWGLYKQISIDKKQTSVIELKYGSLKVKRVILMIPPNSEVKRISLRISGSNVFAFDMNQSKDILTIDFKSLQTFMKGSKLEIEFDFEAIQK